MPKKMSEERLLEIQHENETYVKGSTIRNLDEVFKPLRRMSIKTAYEFMVGLRAIFNKSHGSYIDSTFIKESSIMSLIRLVEIHEKRDDIEKAEREKFKTCGEWLTMVHERVVARPPSGFAERIKSYLGFPDAPRFEAPVTST